MDALTVSLELAAIRERTRRLALWSLIAHAAAVVVFLAAASGQRAPAEPEYVITEITWLDPETPPAPLEAAPVQTDPRRESPPEETSVTVAAAEARPVMPARDPNLDLLQRRLAALRDDDSARRQITAAAAPEPARPHTDPATLGAFTPREAPPARSLPRAAARPAVRAAPLIKNRPSVVGAAAGTLPARKNEPRTAPAQEILPGISLAGEVSDRHLLDFTTPEYPEWAKHDGVEVSVELYFTVLPSGRVKENVLIERTSGYDDFDRRAKAALAAWRFESLGPGAVAEQWGRIEFKYRLRDAG